MAKTVVRDRRGFTVYEMLIVIAITVVLLSLSVVGLLTYMRQLRLTELDNSAREIFLAAQNRAILLSGSQRIDDLVVRDGETNQIRHVDVSPGSTDTTQITVYYLHSTDPEMAELLPAGTVDPTLWEGDFWITYEPESGSVVDVFFSESTLPVSGDFPTFYDTWRAAPKDQRMGSSPMIGYYGGEAAQSGTTLSLRTPIINIVNGNDLLVEVRYWVPRTLAMGAGHTVNLDVTLSYGTLRLPLDLSDARYTSSPDVTYLGHVYTWTLDSLEEDGPRFKNLVSSPGTAPACGDDFTITAEVSYEGALKVNGARKSASDNSLFAKGSNSETAYILCLRHLQNLDKDFSGVAGKYAAVQQSDIAEVEGYAFHPIENEDLRSYDGGAYAVYGLDIRADGSEAAGLFGTLTGTSASAKRLHDIRLINTAVSSQDGPAGALVGDGTYLDLENCLVYWENMSEQATNLRGELGDSAAGLNYQVTGGGVAGGLAGTLKNAELTACAAATLVSGSISGGLVGQGAGLTIAGSYAASYLEGTNAAGLVGNLTGGADISRSYAVGFIKSTGTAAQAAGLCLGGGSAQVSRSYSAMLFTPEKSVHNYPLCQSTSGTYDRTHYLTSDHFGFDQDLDRAVSYSDLSDPDKWSGLFGAGTFASKGAARSHPYNLQTTLSLTTFRYPGLAGLDHWGDWGAQFQDGSLVYYEKYADGSYGFDGEVSHLREEGLVIEDGYAVAYNSTTAISGLGGTLDVTYQDADEGEVTETLGYGSSGTGPIYEAGIVEDLSGNPAYYYLLPLPSRVVNTGYVSDDFYQVITITDPEEGETTRYYYNPHFANPVLQEEGEDGEEAGNPVDSVERLRVIVRSPRHLYMLSKYAAYYASSHQYRFIQELDLDYTAYTGYGLFPDSGWAQSPIGTEEGSPFRGSYFGQHNRITGVCIAAEGLQYVGLFGYTTGVVENVVYEMTQKLALTRSGSGSTALYAGALAGYNGGSIINCAAFGVNLRASGYEYSTVYLGGLVGRNQGAVRNSAAEGESISANASMSHAYVGGFVGSNDAGGAVERCYAVGKASASRARFGTVYAAGFAGRSMGAVSQSYAAVSLTVEGEAESFGFCPDTSTGCLYLNDGNFTYRGTHYAAQYEDPAATPVTWEQLVEDATASQLRMGAQVRADVGGEYPYPGSVTDANGDYVHYGQWPDRMELGAMGIYYWEKLTIGGLDSYHFSVLSLEEGLVERRSTLSTVHGDGGVVSKYGYGYFYTAGTTAPTLESKGIGYGGSNSFLPQPGLEDTAANDALSDLMGGRYIFHSYNTWGTAADGAGLFTVESGQATGAEPPYGTWQLTRPGQLLTVRLNPFFADAMAVQSGGTVQPGVPTALPGTAENPYGVRSIDQLQFINWNHYAKSNSKQMDVGNYYRFPYLCYGTNGVRTLRAFYWEQTHDLEGEKGVVYTPIAAVYDTSITGREGGNLFGWFGGTYDGNDYLIADVDIQGPAEGSSCVGLFGAVYDGTLKNIVLYSADGSGTVTGNNSGGSQWYAIGGLAGLAGASQQSAIVNCAVAGYTIRDVHQTYLTNGWGGTGVGGLVGVCEMDLEGCTAVTQIEFESRNNDNVRIGGLVGSCQGSISSSYTGGGIQVSQTAYTPNGIYVGGIVGGIYMKPLRVGGGANNPLTVGKSGDELQNTLTNCYTYTQLPAANSNWYIKGLYAVGGSGELDADGGTLADHGWTNYENNYYLQAVVLANNDANMGWKRTDIRQSEVIALTYLDMADPVSEKGLLRLLNNNGAGFASVTTQTAGGAPLSGRFSFGVDGSLLGRDYPFPTILTQASEEAGGVAHVHYGDWPLEGIRRENGALPVNLDLFADYSLSDRGAVWMEELTLSGVEGGGTWSATSADNSVAWASLNGSDGSIRQLIITARKAGSTQVKVSYQLGVKTYAITVDVNVTAELRLAPKAGSPIRVLTGAATVTPLTLADRGGRPLPDALSAAVGLSDLTVEYDGAYFESASVSAAAGKPALTSQSVSSVQSDSAAGSTQMTVGYRFRYLENDYYATSALTLQVEEAAITLKPLEFSFPAGAVEGVTYVYAGEDFTLTVGEAELALDDLTITAFEEVTAEFKDVVWVSWDQDNAGALSVTAYPQRYYPITASVQVQFQFTYEGSIHTLWLSLPVTVKQASDGGEEVQP